MEDHLYECGRPHDTLSCLFFTALWLRKSQPILTQVQQTNDIDLICYETLPTKAVACFHVGPMSLGWSVALPAGSDQSSSSSSHEDPNDEHPEDALPAPLHFRWRRDALQRSQVQQDVGLRCVTWNTRGLIGYPFSSLTSKEKQHNDSVYLPEATTSDEFLHALQVLAPRFLLCGTFIPKNANAGGSARCIHKDLLPDDAMVTHVVFC